MCLVRVRIVMISVFRIGITMFLVVRMRTAVFLGVRMRTAMFLGDKMRTTMFWGDKMRNATFLIRIKFKILDKDRNVLAGQDDDYTVPGVYDLVYDVLE